MQAASIKKKIETLPVTVSKFLIKRSLIIGANSTEVYEKVRTIIIDLE